MSQLKITYADKANDAPVGTIERTWRAEDANQVKDVVNALVDIVMGISGGSARYKKQDVSSQSDVTIAHDFGRYPVVQVFNTSGRQVFPKVIHLNENSTQVVWSEPFTGSVVLV